MVTQATHDPTHGYTVTEAAAVVGVSTSQIRNWCTQFADYLSAQATPPAGQSRTLTAADVATLQRVAELRAQGVDYALIPAELTTLDPGELVPYVDPAPAAVQASPAPAGAIELYTAMETRFQQMQGQIDRLTVAQAQEERRRLSTVTMFGFGLLAGILLVALMFAIFAFGAWLSSP